MHGANGPITIHPLRGIGEIGQGTDLVAVLLDALLAALRATAQMADRQDILVVTSKIFSKSEGRFVDLTTVTPGAEAKRLAAITLKDPRLVELVLAESAAVVRAAPHVLITRHRLGLVMANAGIDQSNIGPGKSDRVLLLPCDPDASAASLHNGLLRHLGVAPAIVISDSFGRPWRHGVVSVAIGACGLPALLDKRGECDRDGRTLEVTQIALADVVATAAGLVMGEGSEGLPAALVSGYRWTHADVPAAGLVRPVEQDLFR